MTPRERVECALRGGRPDSVPFTIYANKLPRCQVELEVRNLGACMLERSPAPYTVHTPNVRSTSVQYSENGISRTKTTTETPGGTITTINRPAPGTTWREKLPFSGPDDYAAILAMVRDRHYGESYAAFVAARERYGNGSFLRASIGYSPLQEIIYAHMGVEQFSIEWAERRDDVLKLYDALTEDRRKLYPIIADSPALATNYGGNVSPEIVGVERFERYILPHYDEAAEIIGRRGNLLGVHLDGNTRAIAESVARSRIHYVEAFTPPPDCDLTVREALEMWPDKVLWINFPSSVHHHGVEFVRDMMRDILHEAAPGDRFIAGITEDVPDHAWPETFPAIARVIHDEGRLPVGSD